MNKKVKNLNKIVNLCCGCPPIGYSIKYKIGDNKPSPPRGETLKMSQMDLQKMQ